MEYLAIVLGCGEIGNPIYEMLMEAYGPATVVPYDPVNYPNRPVGKTRFLHICYPQSPGFVESVCENMQRYEPVYVIIHSTVSPQIPRRIQIESTYGFVFVSPVRGNIKQGMRECLEQYTKFVAPVVEKESIRKRQEVRQHLEGAGFHAELVNKAETLCWAKLLDLAWYGLNIAFYQELERVVKGDDYDAVIKFIETTPIESEREVQRLTFYGGYIGGHCVIQGIEKILAEKDIPMLRAVIDSNMKRLVELALKQPEHHP